LLLCKEYVWRTIEGDDFDCDEGSWSMAICVICDDTGILSSDGDNPSFCYCSAGKRAKRQWDADNRGNGGERGSANDAPGFIDVSQLEQVNASVDAMRASLLGTTAPAEGSVTRHPAAQLLYKVAHPGHEVSIVEATQLHDLAKALEGFWGDLSSIGRKKG
jgi:hypothetical protein